MEKHQQKNLSFTNFVLYGKWPFFSLVTPVLHLATIATADLNVRLTLDILAMTWAIIFIIVTLLVMAIVKINGDYGERKTRSIE